MDFEFIGDKRFQILLSRDYLELQNCLEHKASKSVLVLAGSIIEAALSNFFIQFPVSGKLESDILSSNLNSLLDLAEQEKLISSREKSLAVVVKDYRNLIHPGREIRRQESIDIESAQIATSVVDLILKSVHAAYIQKYGHSAKDVLERLKEDWHYQSVFDKVILKLNNHERIVLLNLFIDFDIWEKSFWDEFLTDGYSLNAKETYNLEDVKFLLVKLKPLIPREEIVRNLNLLVKEIEAGRREKAYCIYNLFHEDLHELSIPEQELVVTYMLNLLTGLLENTRQIAYEKTFSTIGKYVTTLEGTSVLKKFIETYMINCGGSAHDMDIFEQIVNGLSTETKIEILQFVTDYLPHKDDIHFHPLESFYDEAFKRGLIVTRQATSS